MPVATSTSCYSLSKEGHMDKEATKQKAAAVEADRAAQSADEAEPKPPKKKG